MSILPINFIMINYFIQNFPLFLISAARNVCLKLAVD